MPAHKARFQSNEGQRGQTLRPKPPELTMMATRRSCLPVKPQDSNRAANPMRCISTVAATAKVADPNCEYKSAFVVATNRVDYPPLFRACRQRPSLQQLGPRQNLRARRLDLAAHRFRLRPARSRGSSRRGVEGDVVGRLGEAVAFVGEHHVRHGDVRLGHAATIWSLSDADARVVGPLADEERAADRSALCSGSALDEQGLASGVSVAHALVEW